MQQVIYGLTVLYFLGLIGVAQAQTQQIVSEVIRGSIFRYPTHVSVDQYTVRITAATALVEFDILSMETTDNTTFSDVNGDCDSAFIDSHLYLFRQETNGALTLLAYNDDEADDNSNYYGKGRRDGSLSTQDSYMIRRLATGTYMLAVGRYPLSSTSARAGKSTESINDFSPYACQMGLASYGNYQLTVRVQSTSSSGIVTKYPNSYVGSSCASAINGVTKQCTYELPGNFASSIRSVCSYDNTV
ncbi:hypothetical protein Poli38472_013999 [Pythium oligandrum]|uniref:Uncharacterized protein n=1 Tax=Pythium oligandrum TaxID=41045 RepID=A0A8K1CQA0_PYTOL|nr:hypothetical protein Poli38472_013999 [Pythium oligandrum]|eukprot:TMW66687.1 hypothetical protein Poli38472_013999 [Pythium oligandrum]